MDRLSSSMSAIDQKMAEMRIKNLEILKRHQEIEEDRQLAQQSSVTTITTTTPTTTTESMKDTTMRVTTKHRGGRNTTTQQNFQENQHERMHRPATRRKFENDWTDNQPQRAQRVDYNRLKRERAQEITNQQYNNNNNNISPELLEYAYPFHYKSETNHDADEPAHAKKLVIINNQANHIGSGRFNQQQQRTQEQGQRRREERMRRSGANNNGHPGGPSEFHLDVPPMSIWPNGSIPQSVHVQILPTNLNGHHTGVDHLMNNGADQLDQSAYVHNFVYPTSAQTSPFNGNGTVYFTHHPPPMTNNPHPSQATQPHFHQYHPTRTFENSNRHQFHHPSQFQTTPLFQHPPPPPSGPPTQLSTPSSSTYIHHQQQQQQEDASVNLPPRFRRPPKSDQENKYSRQRPISGDFEYLHNSSPRFNNENRFKARPQSFYDFSSQQQQQQSNNNFYRPSYNNNNNNNRYQRNNNNNNNNSLPLSAYMNVDESSYENENNNNNYWGTSYQRRRTNQPRTYHHDKHQFPLSSYDPRQYGFNNNYQRRNDFNNRTNFNRRNPNPNYNNQNQNNDSNDIDLIEEWWEDDNTELIGTNQSTISNTDTQITTTATIDDSGNSSLSTSMHLKESTLDDDDDEDTNISNNDFINPSSDISTTDSNIIESLDQLQRQLKFEEDFEKQLASDSDLLLLSKEQILNVINQSSAFDTAHFMQWAKEKFREELAGRLTAQEIEQHDAVVTDEDEDDDEDILNTSDVNLEKYRIDPTIDDDNGNVDELEGDLHEKLKIEENTTKTIAVE